MENETKAVRPLVVIVHGKRRDVERTYSLGEGGFPRSGEGSRLRIGPSPSLTVQLRTWLVSTVRVTSYD